MEVKFVVIAMQKCCNHGITNWIGHQSKETLLFDVNDYDTIWYNKDIAKAKIRDMFTYKVENSKETHYTFNLEEFDLKYFEELTTKEIFKSNPLVLIFGRDPFNWLASCYNDKFAKPQKTRYTELLRPWKPAFAPYLTFSSRMDTYKQHMFEALGKTNYLKGFNFVFINYNKWFADESYRDELSEQLGINKGSKGMDWTSGGLFLYSNFSKVNTPKNKNSVLSRYKIFESDKEFRELCTDDELMYISKELFDFIPEWRN